MYIRIVWLIEWKSGGLKEGWQAGRQADRRAGREEGREGVRVRPAGEGRWKGGCIPKVIMINYRVYWEYLRCVC